MGDNRVDKLARILVDYSIDVKPGERVMIEATAAAEPLVRSIYRRILERGGHPLPLFNMIDQEEILLGVGNNDQLDFVPMLHKYAVDQVEARIRIYSEDDTRAAAQADAARVTRRLKALWQVTETVLQRAARGNMRWVATLFPTVGYAVEAEMGWQAYQDFVYKACYADEVIQDPVAAWQKIEADQKRYLERIEGHDKVTLRGPNVDLTLSVKGRTFMNSSGKFNMPDGEIYTGPVEDSANGWVRYTYPAVRNGRMVEGVELHFKDGHVEKATAQKDEAFLLNEINSDAGASYIGEFAIGTNYQIDRFTRNILFDEKIGGSFHMALGFGYPETGSKNRSSIHWDMICDMRQDSEILVDGEVIYHNGRFTF